MSKDFEESHTMAMFVRIILDEVQDVMKRTVPTMVEAIVHEFRASIPITVQEVMKNLGQNSSSRSLPCNINSSASKHLKMSFVGTLPDTLLTWNNIQDEGASLEVELQDSSGSRVEVGPEASSKIQLCVLDGDFEVEDRDYWTEEEFNKMVAQPRKDKAPLLKGKHEIYLSRGAASVIDIAFTDNSKSIRNGRFRLGAKVVKGLSPGVEIRTAVSEPFQVKERRVKSYRKHCSPSLEDGTDCLKNIGKTLCQKLADQQIYTVKDFLQLYHSDPNMLRNILQVSESKWLDLVKNAQLCSLSAEHYEFSDEASQVDLLLDCVFNVVRVHFNGHVIQPYHLTDMQKKLVDKIRLAAYKKRAKLPKIYMDLPPTIPASVQTESLDRSIIAHSNMQHLDMIAADTTALMPCVNPAVNSMLEGQYLHGFTPNETNQVLRNQNSLGLSAGQELLSLMPPEPGMRAEQTQDTNSQNQSCITSPNSRLAGGTDIRMNEQLRLGCGNDMRVSFRRTNVPEDPDSNVQLKRPRLGGCH